VKTFVDTNVLVYARASASAGRLVSEGLQDGRRFGALTIENPFIAD
jgi:predicted nucleic acid-binding protein